jgi:hypothetical protein
MALLALLSIGGVATVMGLAGGTVASSAGLLVGPRGLDLCTHGALAAVLAAIACGVSACAVCLIEPGRRRSPGDFTHLMAGFAVGGLLVGYAASCTIVIGASALHALAVEPHGDISRCSVGGFALACGFGLFAILAPFRRA